MREFLSAIGAGGRRMLTMACLIALGAFASWAFGLDRTLPLLLRAAVMVMEAPDDGLDIEIDGFEPDALAEPNWLGEPVIKPGID